MKKSSDRFMKEKMDDLVNEDDQFTKWWNESKLDLITGQISNDFDHKKNWSKQLDDNVRGNESLLDFSEQLGEDTWTKFKNIECNSRLDDLGLILHNNNSNQDNVNNNDDLCSGVNNDRVNMVSGGDRMHSLYTANTDNVND